MSRLRGFNNHDPSIHEGGPNTSRDLRGIAAIVRPYQAGLLPGEFAAVIKNHPKRSVTSLSELYLTRKPLLEHFRWLEAQYAPPFLFDSAFGSAISASRTVVTAEEVKNAGRLVEYDWDAMLGEIILMNIRWFAATQAELVKRLFGLVWPSFHR